MPSPRKEAISSNGEVCSWAELLEYEKSDIILFILRTIKGSFFRNDSLILTEREDIRSISSSDAPAVENRLLLEGTVGYGRRDLFLLLVRFIRLRRVSDLATNVSLRYMIGDELPHCFLEPLLVSTHTKSFLRWYRIALAIKYGIMERMKNRMEHLRKRLTMIMKESSNVASSTLDEGKFYDDSIPSFSMSSTTREKDSSNKRVVNFSNYVAALEDSRINIRQISATAPTLFIFWSYLDFECIEWLKNVFNRKVDKTHTRTHINFTDHNPIFVDIWMELVRKYDAIPERPLNLSERAILDGFKPPKRAQIVLINVDRNVAEARATYTKLCSRCSGWSSLEVSLISLWAGPEGLQSEICNMFNPLTLPFLMVTRPVKKRNLLYSPYRVHPCIIQASSLTTAEPFARHKAAQSTSQAKSTYWYYFDAQQRRSIASQICSLVYQLNVPISFKAKVDCVYKIRNPFTDISTKALESTYTSVVFVQGQISDRDMASISTAVTPLIDLADFHFEASIVKFSSPLDIKQDLVIPVYYTFAKSKVISCTSCFNTIDICTSPLYRCLHCLQRCGVICEHCFESNSSRIISKRHPQHHIFARIPPVVSSLSLLPVLWGPSNVIPFQPSPAYATQSLDLSKTVHLGVYCDNCLVMIRGVRWKCAVCYAFDYCNSCFQQQVSGELEFLQNGSHCLDWAKTTSISDITPKSSTRRKHDLSHPMLCIPPYLRKNEKGDAFLQPLLLKIEDVLS